MSPGAAEPTHGIRLRDPDGGSGIDASTIHINNNAFIDGGVNGDAKAIDISVTRQPQLMRRETGGEHQRK